MLKMPLVNKNYIKYLKSQIALLNFIIIRFLITMGKMTNFDILYFMHLIH